MNERIKELAEQAGFECWKDEPYRPEGQTIDWASNYDEELEKFAELVRADEREACAKVCENMERNGAWITKTEAAEAIRARGDDLKDAIEKGTKAWADVPNASEWVDELRGNDKPLVKSYCGGKPNYCTPEVPCKTHPDAPHGFNRNASFDEDRYVCDCEFWEPDVDNSAHEAEDVHGNVDNVYMSEKRVHKSDKSIHEPVAIVNQAMGGIEWLEAPLPDDTPLYAAGVLHKEWVGLRDEEIEELAKWADEHAAPWHLEFARAIEAKLKQKNNGA